MINDRHLTIWLIFGLCFQSPFKCHLKTCTDALCIGQAPTRRSIMSGMLSVQSICSAQQAFTSRDEGVLKF